MFMFLVIMLPRELQMIAATVLIVISSNLMIRKAIRGGKVWVILISSVLSAGMLYCIYQYWERL